MLESPVGRAIVGRDAGYRPTGHLGELTTFADWLKYPPDVDEDGRRVRPKGEATRAAYLYSVGRYLEWLSPRAVSTATAREWIAEISKTNKPRSIARHMDALSCFFKSLGLRLAMAKPAYTVPIPRVMVSDEFDKFMAAAAAGLTAPSAYGRYRAVFRYAVVMVFLGSGIRKSEGLGLQTGDVAWVAKPREGSLHVLGKGGKERVVPVEGEVVEAVEAWLKVRRGNSPWLFPGRDPSKPLTRHAVESVVKQIAEEAGVPDIHPHTLRHSFATRALDRGAPIHVIQQILGHANIQTTMHYLHITTKHVTSRMPAVVGTHRPGEVSHAKEASDV